ncbi:AAA family ATPase [Clostridium pasteurianum]|uniref:AAA family ATPase n=1 Tax=Clostridium pasteurianum TaxID=1501 RepID=UPI002260ED46|nr:AAA family ATPase [Clostridium pasteurianum]UZW16041.1 AAA family ATPase [Clostridium pasteurianum]
MKKKFNVTGTCIPEKHYMVDISEKLKDIMKLIENEEYFIINRPRQYGKTTTLFLLNKKLKKDQTYLPIKISFEGIGDSVFESEKNFSKTFLQILERNLLLNDKNLANFLEEQEVKVQNLNDLSNVITKLVVKADKKVVLMIDEVDKSSNNQLFLSFLGMLRNKYLLRNEGEDVTFHSVILAGVHDIKSLKIKIRSDGEHKYNSPWNIASDFDVDMSFSKEEIGTMLEDYIKNKGVKLDKEYFSERLYFYTSGYPFLVSKICKIIDEKIMLDGELQWKKEYMDIAVKKLVNDDNTNFQSLIKNIENNIELKEMVKNLIIDGSKITSNINNPVINLGMLYGIFKNEELNLKMNNRIYEQIVYDYLSSLIETSTDVSFYNEKSKFIKENGNLDIKKVIIKFQEFMKHEYSRKGESFLEEDGRLLFLAFLSPIINGTGFAFKEVKGGEEKRFDIVITYEKKIYILELKIWRGDKYHEKGLAQLAEYLEQYGLEEGYLLIFDFRKVKGVVGKVEEVTVKINEKEKKIVEVYC